MSELSMRLNVIDVEGGAIFDPRVHVRACRPDFSLLSQWRIEPWQGPASLEFDGPAQRPVFIRVTPSRYEDGAMLCDVDGNGVVALRQPFRLPRRPAEWMPSFVRWQQLAPDFDGLKRVLDGSPTFRCGRTSQPGRFIGERFDTVTADDESEALAKLSLLNMYSRLRVEEMPGTAAPWFAQLRTLLYSTRERIVAEIHEECWRKVRAVATHSADGYRGVPVGNHIGNLRAEPGVTQVTEAASIKSDEDKANLQFTVARAVKDGREVFLLDADMDEHANLLLHFFDIIEHAFSGGTHPIYIHECLRLRFPGVPLGYRVEPRQPIGETSARVVGIG